MSGQQCCQVSSARQIPPCQCTAHSSHPLEALHFTRVILPSPHQRCNVAGVTVVPRLHLPAHLGHAFRHPLLQSLHEPSSLPLHVVAAASKALPQAAATHSLVLMRRHSNAYAVLRSPVNARLAGMCTRPKWPCSTPARAQQCPMPMELLHCCFLAAAWPLR